MHPTEFDDDLHSSRSPRVYLSLRRGLFILDWNLPSDLRQVISAAPGKYIPGFCESGKSNDGKAGSCFSAVSSAGFAIHMCISVIACQGQFTSLAHSSQNGAVDNRAASHEFGLSPSAFSPIGLPCTGVEGWILAWKIWSSISKQIACMVQQLWHWCLQNHSNDKERARQTSRSFSFFWGECSGQENIFGQAEASEGVSALFSAFHEQYATAHACFPFLPCNLHNL